MHAEMTPQSLVFALGAILDGGGSGGCDPAAIVAQAIRHRVAPLLARTPFAAALDATAAAALAEDVRLTGVHGALLDQELDRVLRELAARGIRPLVTKGAQLAHAIYDSPHLRPRADTDLLIHPADRRAITEALTALGYAPSAATSGEVIYGEFNFERTLRAGVVHYLDIHWRAAAPLLFAHAFDMRAMLATAQPLPGLSPHANGPALHHALGLGCIHVVAHHWDTLLLVWLHDLRLLADALDEEGSRLFVAAAIAGKYCDLAYCALRTTRLYFRSVALDRLIDRLAPLADGREPSAVLTHEGRGKVDDLLLDLKGAGWRERAQLIREHVFPPPAYMRAVFGDGPLALAYTRRVLRGVRRWF
jgi:hypothetical protein